MKSWQQWCLGLLLAGMAASAGAQALQPVPKLEGRVTDLTGTLTAGEQTELERKLASFEARKGSQVAVLVVATTQPEAIEQYSIRVVDAWKLGRAKPDDGALLLLAKDDRALRIEVGYGLEGALTDATSNRIIQETMVPLLRQGSYAAAISAGVDQMIRVIDGEPLPAPDRRWQGSGEIRNYLPFIFIGYFVISGILRSIFGRGLGAVFTGGAMGGIVWLLTQIIAFSAGAAALAFIFSLIFGASRSWTSGPRGGGWPGGFGGGFGGFGGGGGFAAAASAGAAVASEAAARRAAGDQLMRYFRHWYHGLRGARAAFPVAVRASIEREIGEAERQHRGEICFAIEAALPLAGVARGASARQSALAAFASLGVWDTEANNGVLIYVLLADRSVELVADRGIASRIADSEWRSLCGEVEACFRRAEFEKGSLLAVHGVAQRLAQHFPAAASRANELPNQPVLL